MHQTVRITHYVLYNVQCDRKDKPELKTRQIFMTVNVEKLLSDLDTNVIIGILSGRATRVINRELQRSFKAEKLDITPDQWIILLSLKKNNDVSQQMISDITFRDKPNISRILSLLEHKEFVSRRTDDNDKRNNIVSITPKGEEQVERAHQAAVRTMKRAIDGFTEKDVFKLQKMMKAIFSNLI